MLGFSMEAFGNLPPDAQAVLRKAGRHPRYDEEVPHSLAKPPRQRPRFPNDSELSLLLLVLRGVVEADKKRLLQPATLDDPKGICVLSIDGDPAAPRVSVTRERVPQQQRARTVPLVAEKIDVKGLPRLDATWLVGMPTVPLSVQGMTGSRRWCWLSMRRVRTSSTVAGTGRRSAGGRQDHRGDVSWRRPGWTQRPAPPDPILQSQASRGTDPAAGSGRGRVCL